MCGSKLPLPEPIAPRPEPAVLNQEKSTPNPVSGPSFLGLAGDEHASNVSYLLEDEVSSSHRGRIVTLLLIVALAISAWHWRHNWHDLVARVSSQVNGQATQTPPAQPATQPSATPAVSASPSEVTPAMPTSDQSQADKPKTGVGDEAPATPSTNQNPTTTAGSPSAPDNKSEAKNQPPATSEKVPAASPSVENSPSDDSKGDQTADAKQTPAKSPVRMASRKSEEAPQPAKSADAGDALETEGERYLYGNGVPANCDRAQRSLLAAANDSNPKAATVLGTMYATGHCTSRDLPLAYKWFAKALQADPGNNRYQRDLEVLWNQMSPDERQLAMKNR